MPLAEYKGGLIVKVEIDEDGNEVRKLCTTCCGDEPGTGRCCVYTGNQVDQGCGDTPDAARDEAELLAKNYTNGFIGVPVEEGDELCLYSCAVYEWLPEFGVVCWDEDEDGNPVTKDFCDAQCSGLEDTRCVFTAGADCGGDNSGTGTCPLVLPNNRSNPLP